MKCPRCQAENPPGTRFCGQCAAPLGSVCPSCGATNPPENKFCGQCAAPLDKPAQPRFLAPESYTPRHLAERILTSKAALEGERKQVTVLFADLKGSMELLADRDPEDARKILDPVLEFMMEAVHRYEGTVNQVMGDGIMALFGAPLAHEDHAVRACYAALRMQESVKRHAESIRREEGVTIRIRVGLNSGEVVVRSIGGDLHMDYTAVGQTTHLAARMEQLAEPGTTLLTSATLALSEDFVQVKSLGPMRVKGLSEAVDVYELVGAHPVRSRFQAHAARGLTKFVGRASEMTQLVEALDLARSARGQVVAVVGEPGVGKSRLFWEFAHSHRVDGCVVVEAASVSYGRGTPYLPVIELLRGYFQIEPRDDPRKIREKVTGKLFSLDRALEPVLAALLSLLDVSVDDEEWTRLDPPQRRQRTLDAVKRLLLRESHVQPLVVIFEDVHWIDGETQAMLEGLVESLPTARVLLLVNYRPEYQHHWSSKTYYRQLRVDPLRPESVDELLEGLLGNDAALLPLEQLLIERTEGNPFFLEESVRTLIEAKVLVGERGAYRLAKAAREIHVPTTAQAVLAARIDRLDPEDKRLLQAAAAIGKDFAVPLLVAVAEMTNERLHSSLSRLQAAEFVYEAKLFPEVECTFKHALTHEVAYGSLLQERRRALDVRIVDAIETLYPDRLVEHVERLAHHAVRGEAWGKAVAYLHQSGTKAMTRSVYREAVAYFEQALVALRGLPESRETLERGVQIRLDLRNSLVPVGEPRRALDYLLEAQMLAGRLDDKARLGLVAAYLTVQFWHVGETDRALASGEQALALAAHLQEVPLQVISSFFMGQATYRRGDYRRSMELLRMCIDSLHGDLVHGRFGLPFLPAVHARAWLACAMAETGAFHEAGVVTEEATRLAQEADHPFSLITACFGRGTVALLNGRFSTAVPVLEQGIALCSRWEIKIWFPALASPLGLAYARSGRGTEATALLEEAAQQVASRGISWSESAVAVALGETYLLVGRIADAARSAERALDVIARYKEDAGRAQTLHLLGTIAAHRDSGDAATAERRYRESITLATELGMRPLVAHCHFGLGKLYRSTGKRWQAQEHLTTAITMYREMDMRFWLEKAEAEQKA